MKQSEKAARFAALHVKGSPLLLYNAWDAGSARSISEAGAKAIATSSWAVAEAQGYRDGETIPVGLVEQIAGRIVDTIDLAVTIDFEGGYSEDEGEIAENVSRLLDLGVVGINFEDRVVKGVGLYAVDRQAHRIAAIRDAADKKGLNLFINDVKKIQVVDPPPLPTTSPAQELERLHALLVRGAISQLEFDGLKAKLLGSAPSR